MFISTIDQTNAQLLLGPKAGARVSWLKYEDFAEEDFERKLSFGYTAGITTAYKVKKRYLIQMDIMYTQNGKKIDGISDPLLKNYARYHYLNTPIVYKVDFKESFGDKAFKWYVGAGPNVNFWLGGSGTLKSIELAEENIEQINYKLIFSEEPANPENGGLYVTEANRLQVGLIISTGIVLEPMPGQTVMIDLRYEWGHSYMARAAGSFTDVLAYKDNLIARNQAIQLSVSYVFDVINKGKKEKKLYYQN